MLEYSCTCGGYFPVECIVSIDFVHVEVGSMSITVGHIPMFDAHNPMLAELHMEVS